MSDNRIRTIRRRTKPKGETPKDSQAEKAVETATETANEAAPESKPLPKKKKARVGPTMDVQALEAEVDALGPDAMGALLGATVPNDPEPGQQVSGTVVTVTETTIFVDIGAKSEAAIDRASFANSNDLEMGQKISAYVVRVDHRGIQLAPKLSGAGAKEMLSEAYTNKIPVEGKVASRNPGGFTIEIAGISAFCPVSQIARNPGDDLDSYIGQTMLFRIHEFKERDVVVSHRAIEDEEAAGEAAKAWEAINVGDEREGVVTGTEDFGVFVDIGGIQGLLHKSEFNVGEGSEAPEKGATITVRVKSVDTIKQRVSLALAGEQSGPWAQVGSAFVEGGSYTGTVTRVADFGAFVKLGPGLEGLVHVSQLADRRVDHPRTVVKQGQEVTVKIIEIDEDRGRISLSMKKDAATGSSDWKKHTGTKQKKQSLGTFADLLGGLKIN